MNSIKDQIDDHAKAIAELEAQLHRDDRLDHAYERSRAITTAGEGKPPSRTRFYRDKVRGKLWGVCAGLADYTGIDVLWIRIAAIASVFITSGLTLILYPIITLMSPVRPTGLYDDPIDAKFWQGVRTNSSRSTKDVRSKLRDIDRRIADIEAHFVSSNRRLSDEIDALK